MTVAAGTQFSLPVRYPREGAGLEQLRLWLRADRCGMQPVRSRGANENG